MAVIATPAGSDTDHYDRGTNAHTRVAPTAKGLDARSKNDEEEIGTLAGYMAKYNFCMV